MALDQATKVLLAELLGDLTAVREELDRLPGAVRQATDASADAAARSANAINRATQQLIEAGNRHQALISEHVEKISVTNLQAAAHEAGLQMEEQIQRELRRALREAREAGSELVAPSPSKRLASASPAGHSQTVLILSVAAICLLAGVAIGWMARGL